MIRNPVMFVTMIGAIITTYEIFVSHELRTFVIQIAIWLWFTVLFANFAEAMAEGRGKSQADALRKSRTQLFGLKYKNDGTLQQVAAEELRQGDIVLVVAGEVIPAMEK